MLDNNSVDINVLLIDDDEDSKVLVGAILEDIERTNFSLDWCSTYDKGVEEIRTGIHDICLLDYRLGAKDGVELLREALTVHISFPIIILTGQQSSDLDIQALKAGASDYLTKDELNGKVLNRAIRYAIGHKQVEETLYKMARFDSLTGLANRSMFMETLRRSVAQSARHDTISALFILDIDHFKNINDSLGHDVGDELLRSFTNRLVSCVRTGDLVARLGGDEFAVILDQVDSEKSIAVFAQKILVSMGPPHQLGEHALLARVSIGIITYPGVQNDVETLIKSADTAMYVAKRRGRNNYQFFVHEMQNRAVERTRFEADLSYAVERNELQLHYQPQIEARTGKIVSAEALLRWKHSGRDEVPPSTFIPIAEECGQIFALGEWVLRKACKEANVWQRNYPQIRMGIAINISANQLMQLNIVNVIDLILTESCLDPALLEIELTEGIIMEDPEYAIKIFNTLKEMGIHISIDDFGTGYSSLKYLAELPIDILKIDQAFVQGCIKNKKKAAIVKSTIALAHNLDFQVVAEGVETEEQARFLIDHDCDILQGFYYSRAIPSEQLIRDWIIPGCQ